MNKTLRTLTSASSCLLALLIFVVSAQTRAASPVVAWGSNTYGQTNIPPGLANIVAIAAGYAHNLALRPDGTVTAWGYNSSGQTNVPAGLTGVMAIAAGNFNSLALKTDGTLVAWGYGGYGLNAVPPGFTNLVAIAAGAYHNLAIRANGTVAGWGDNSGGQLNVPQGLVNVVAVAGGLQHSLALKADNTVVAWGSDSSHQAEVPPGLSNVVAIAAGTYHNLALLAGGSVVAWGSDSYGQIDVPARLTNVIAVACGNYHSLALKADGTVVAWGNNSSGQARPPLGMSNVVAVTGGNMHSLALIGAPPAIIAQPRDLSVAEMSAATFSVSASGVPQVQYQWAFNGSNIAGATGSSFTLASARLSDAGSYSVRVTNPLGSVVSAPAVLTVNPLLVARCADITVAAGDDCRANVSVDNGSFDPTGGFVTLTQSPPGPYPLGTNQVTLIVKGSQGGSASCTALVIVVDRTAPLIIPPADIVATNDLNQCGGTVAFAQPQASDACSAVTSVTCTPPSGSFFPVGTTTVQCAATDAAGNVGQASFTVTVYDRQAPSIICPAEINVTNVHGAWTSVVTYSPVAEDNCPGLGLPVCNPPSGSAFGPGTHTVNCWATDAAGNTSTCSFQVTVWPNNLPPVPVIEVSPLVRMPGYTNLIVLASNGTNATVTFDGSKSFDPDDAVFNFAWFNGNLLFSTNKVAAATLPFGSYVITLVLDDTLPSGTSQASVQVEVLSPAEGIWLLVSLVENSGLWPSVQTPLLATLSSSIASVQRGNLVPALNQLQAFQNKVQAQVGRSNPALAATLIQAAQQIIDALSPAVQPKH